MLHDGRVDVVEAIDIALGAVGRERSGAEADHADLERLRGGMQHVEQEPDARAVGVVGGRPPAKFRLHVLRPVQDRAVDQRPAMIGTVAAELLHAQHAVEIALGDDRAVVELDDGPDGAACRSEHRGGGEQRRRRYAPCRTCHSRSNAATTSPPASSKYAGSTSGATIPTSAEPSAPPSEIIR